jgi:hypothetical protein
MEKGFYHPARGYWQTTGDVPQDILDGYPVGTVEVPIEPGADHEWDGEAWVYIAPDPAIALENARATAASAMLGWIETLLSQFTEGVPAIEVASWSQKAAAARSFLAGDAAPQVTDEAAVTGEDPQDLALAIVGKADLYTAIIARATGLRRATLLAIDSAETPEAVAATIASAKASAEVMLADLGLAKREDG